ncbi:MAG: hypothetical protein AMXMBFR64_36480 [Myxococcales bacterium]
MGTVIPFPRRPRGAQPPQTGAVIDDGPTSSPVARQRPTHRSPQDAPPPHQELATLLQLARRDIVRLSREELARQLGGSDVRSLAERIERFERAEELPGEDEARRLSELLELDPERLVALARAARSAYDIRAGRARATRSDTRLLAENLDRLLAMYHTIEQRPGWRDIRVYPAHARVFFRPGGRLPLGALLGMWRDGVLVVESDGHRWYVFQGGGSPLSGRGAAVAFRAGTGEWRTVSDTSHFAQRAIRRVDRGPGSPALSLGQLLSTLGIPVPDIAVFEGADVVARYVHAERALYDRDGDRVFVIAFDPSGLQSPAAPYPDELPHEAPWDGSTRYRGWRIEPVALVGPQRTLWTSGVLPPPAAVALLDWLGTDS